jgi:peroxiredoxin
MLNRTLFAIVAAGGLLISSQAALAQAGDKPASTTSKQAEKKTDKAAPAKVGEAAPSFELTDTDGKTVKLEDYKDKIVVLEWFNPECPHVVKHHAKNTTFNDLHKEFADKGVVFLAVNSGAAGMQGSGKDLNAKYKKDWNKAYPILLDESGSVGKAYGATTTPHMFIIGKDGKLAYKGGIDNNKAFDAKDYKNYVEQTLNQMIKGETVTEPETKNYGCGVKYGKK